MESPKLTHVWITKYCLTKGIIEADATIRDSDIAIVSNGGGYMPSYYHTKEFHTDYASAKAHAEELRIRKMNALQRQMIALKKLEF